MNVQAQAFTQELGGRIKKASGWFIAFGVLLILGGMAAIARPLHAGVALALVVGWVLIINGVMAAANALFARGAGGFLWRLLMAFLYIAGGIMVLRSPVAGLAALTLILGGMLIFGGISRLLLASALSGVPGVGLIIFGAILSIVLGFMVLMKLPQSSEFVVGTLIGLDFITSGISILMFGGGARKLGGALNKA